MDTPKTSLPLGTLERVYVAKVLSRPDPCPYLMSFGFDLNNLRRSIARVGIINPPILRRDGSNKIQIVTGYKRLRAANELGMKEVTCRVLMCHELSEREAFLVALYENLSMRTFNIIEKALALKALGCFYTIEEIIRDYMPLLDLPRTMQVYNRYLEMEERLSAPIKEALATGKMQIRTAEILLEIDDDSRDTIFRFGTNLNLNINQWHQFVELTIDLMKLENRQASDILGEASIALLNKGCYSKNLPQQANAILQFLRSKRYPKATVFQKEIRKKLGQIKLPKGARFVFPPYAEEPVYKLEVLFKEGASLHKSLLEIANAPALTSIRQPLSEAILACRADKASSK